MIDSFFKIGNNQIAEGIEFKILYQEDAMVMTQLKIQKGARLAGRINLSNHSACLLQGKVRVIVDGVASEFRQGDCWCMGKNISHTIEALEDLTVLEVFNPEGEIEGFQNRRDISKLSN